MSTSWKSKIKDFVTLKSNASLLSLSKNHIKKDHLCSTHQTIVSNLRSECNKWEKHSFIRSHQSSWGKEGCSGSSSKAFFHISEISFDWPTKSLPSPKSWKYSKRWKSALKKPFSHKKFQINAKRRIISPNSL